MPFEPHVMREHDVVQGGHRRRRIRGSHAATMARMAALPLPSLAALVALVVALTGTAAADAGRVVVYPAPSGQPLNPAYIVKVRAVGGDWRQLDVFKAIVDRDTFSSAAMVGFDADGP